MTFKHKLSSRLALLKDRVVLASLAGLVTAAIVACELPVRATDPGSTIADLLVSPKTLTLRQNATADFTAVGFMSTGDSASVAVSWSVTAGSIIDTSSNGKRHYGHYKAGPNPGQYKVVATGNPGGVSDTALVTVTLAPVRSEEHTSDSSHLVISYAVFCLKKKKILDRLTPPLLRGLIEQQARARP